MSLNPATFQVGDQVRLRCDMFGYAAGMIGTVVEVLTVKENDQPVVPAVLVELHSPASRLWFMRYIDESTGQKRDQLDCLERVGPEGGG